MTPEITNELSIMQKTSDIMSEQLFSWAKRIKVKRAQKLMLTNIHKNKDFDMIKYTKLTNKNMNMSNSQCMTKRRCQYCDIHMS